MSNIVQRTAGTVAQQAQNDWGIAIEGQGDFTLRCEIGQPMSKKGEPGKFNFSSPEWPATERLKNVVVVYPGRTRVLFGANFGDKSRCRSDNWHQPSQSIADPITDHCETCFASKWDSTLTPEELVLKRKLEKELKKTESEKPLCNDTVNLYVVDDRMTPFILKFQKTQLKKVQQELINRIKFSGKRPFQMMFDVSLKLATGVGKYYEYVFENFRPVDDYSKHEELFSFFRDHGQETLATAINKMDQEKDAAPYDGNAPIPSDDDIPPPAFDSDEEIPF